MFSVLSICFLPANFHRTGGNDCNCPVPCNTISYKPVLSYATFPSEHFTTVLVEEVIRNDQAFAGLNQSEIQRRIKTNSDAFSKSFRYEAVRTVIII